ncbi:hypothetical protein CPB83DRAFT_776443 [Crepidotus variabilis]|uniref:Protein kinase domain-containing protein n=1 Tax=Crepidotus variabilis TaxID=179855 RepID=A0A9P6JJ12_9AGAR|nr:hypothetical protein CPB83DRAFT_776443 [Crepidotus variabilis]
MAPNCLEFWGETLLDFFNVQRFPGVSNLRTISTGSKLYAWCKENGEAEGTTWNGKEVPAKDCIMWSKDERDPELVEVYDITTLIEEREKKIREASPSESTDTLEESNTNKWPPPSAFDPAAYPPSWNRLHPFLTDGPGAFLDIPALEHYIPQHMLPEKLVVHDPYSLLRALPLGDADSSTRSETFSAKPDRTYAYRLKSSTKHTSRREEDKQEMHKEEARKKAILVNFLSNPHSSVESKPPGIEIYVEGSLCGKIPPPVYVILPPQPALAAASEAHLYLSRSNYIGSGNHSCIYHAEWEVPRSLLVPELLCTKCVMKDATEILKQEDGEDGELMDPRWKELNGEIGPTQIDKDSLPIIMPIEGISDLVDGLYEFPRHPHDKPPPPVSYTGPYRVIHSRCQYQSLERSQYCEHLEDLVHPLTTKVRVAAKLSIEHDQHLVNEANNYQAFPKHFFQHWSGFNVINPIHDPTPVGPLVPQFYGYYVPEEREEKEAKHQAEDRNDSMDDDAEEGENDADDEKDNADDEDDDPKPYLSPLLLMEHCGKPINTLRLSIDDKNECAALCFRLNHAAWVHNSVYQRNILRKPGPLSASPSVRIENKKKRGGYGVDWSFRLIDFGRTEYVGDTPGNGIIGSLDHENQKIKMWHGDLKKLL